MKVSELAAHLRQLATVQADLTVLTAGIIYIQDPLGMALSAVALSAVFGVKGLAMNEGITKDVPEVGNLGDDAVDFGALLCNLYR